MADELPLYDSPYHPTAQTSNPTALGAQRHIQVYLPLSNTFGVVQLVSAQSELELIYFVSIQITGVRVKPERLSKCFLTTSSVPRL